MPVVLTQGVAIYREVEGYAAGIIADDTVAALAEAMLEVRHAQAQYEMSRAAAQLARERFSMEAMQQGLMRLYQQVLAF